MSKTAIVFDARPPVINNALGLGDAERKLIAESLSDITIQTYRTLLRSQVVHWNVTGPLFHAIHDLTEQHYTDLFAAIDALAERIRALGFPVPTGKAAIGLDSALAFGARLTASSMVDGLIDDHRALVQLIREGVGLAGEVDDFVSRNLLTERLAFHEKAIRILSAVVVEERA